MERTTILILKHLDESNIFYKMKIIKKATVEKYKIYFLNKNEEYIRNERGKGKFGIEIIRKDDITKMYILPHKYHCDGVGYIGIDENEVYECINEIKSNYLKNNHMFYNTAHYVYGIGTIK